MLRPAVPGTSRAVPQVAPTAAMPGSVSVRVAADAPSAPASATGAPPATMITTAARRAAVSINRLPVAPRTRNAGRPRSAQIPRRLKGTSARPKFGAHRGRTGRLPGSRPNGPPRTPRGPDQVHTHHADRDTHRAISDDLRETTRAADAIATRAESAIGTFGTMRRSHAA